MIRGWGIFLERNDWMQLSRSQVAAILLGLGICSAAGHAIAGEPVAGQLHVGWATVDITPSAPVVLDGSGYKRVTNEVEDPVTATVLALETRDGDQVLEQAIMVTFDLVRMTKEVHQGLQRVAAEKLADFDSSKLVCGATHTHCGPSISYKNTGPGQLYDISDRTDVMTPQQYILFLYEKVGEGIVEAWQKPQTGGRELGLGRRRRRLQPAAELHRRIRHHGVRHRPAGLLPRRGATKIMPWRCCSSGMRTRN